MDVYQLINNNIVFFLLLIFRRWAGKSFKLILLNCGYVILVISCIYLAIISDVVFKKVPNWVATEKNIYTVVNQNLDGSLRGVNKNVVRAVNAAPWSTDVSHIIKHNFSLQLPNGESIRPSAVFFSKNLAQHLELPILSAKDNVPTGIWISNRLWKSYFDSNPNITDEVVFNSRIEKGIPIAGVLPESLNNIGPWVADIWLDDQFYRYTTPFTQDLYIDRFLNAAPIFYTFFSTTNKFDLGAVKTYLKDQDFSVSKMKMATGESQLTVLKGLVLDESAYDLLLQQFLFLVLFIVCLAVTLLLNSLSIHSTQTILNSGDDNIITSVGKRNGSYLYATFLFSVINSLFITITSVIGFFVSSLVFNRLEIFKQFQSVLSLSPSYGNLVIVNVIAFILIAALYSLPYIAKRSKTYYSRMTSKTFSSTSKILVQFTLCIQLLVVILSVGLVLNLSAAQIKSLNQYAMNDDSLTSTISLAHSNTVSDGLISELENIGVAVASTPFNQPTPITLQDSRLNATQPVYTMFVSRSFFKVLMPSEKVDENWHNGIFINHKLKDIFKNTEINLIGSPINLGDILGTFNIVGDVPNLPHLGKSTSAIPMIYIPISKMHHDVTAEISIFHNRKLSDQEIQTTVSKHFNNVRMTDMETISDILWEQDFTRLVINVITLIFVASIIALTVLSFAYQLSAQISSSRTEYAIYRAVGVPKINLFWEINKNLAQSILAAAVLSIFLFKPITARFLQIASLELNLINQTLVLSIIFTIVFSIVISILPFNRMLNASIYQSLK